MLRRRQMSIFPTRSRTCCCSTTTFNDEGKLIVTISQNSVGNAITELLGIVVQRTQDEAAYLAAEPALVEKLLEVRRRLVAADLGEPIDGPSWRDGEYVAPSDR